MSVQNTSNYISIMYFSISFKPLFHPIAKVSLWLIKSFYHLFFLLAIALYWISRFIQRTYNSRQISNVRRKLVKWNHNQAPNPFIIINDQISFCGFFERNYIKRNFMLNTLARIYDLSLIAVVLDRRCPWSHSMMDCQW